MADQFGNAVTLVQPEFEYLQKWLGNRQFEGCRTGRGFLTLDEYCNLIRMYQNWRRDSDEAILRYIAVSFSGRALKWWSNNINNVASLKELEEQLRLRFDQETNIALCEKFFRRHQRADEPLLDFIDEKLYISKRVKDMREDNLIALILSGVNEKYLSHFLNSGIDFKTLDQFTRFAVCIVRMIAAKDEEEHTRLF